MRGLNMKWLGIFKTLPVGVIVTKSALKDSQTTEHKVPGSHWKKADRLRKMSSKTQIPDLKGTKFSGINFPPKEA